MEYYSSIKTNDIVPFVATWLDLDTVILSELSQTDVVVQMLFTQI